MKDLKNMTRKELEKLSRDIEKALNRLKKQDLKKAKDAAAKAAAAHGFTLNELVGSAPKAKAARPKTTSKMKYANPADASQTWTGKGRQPNWYKDAVASGKSPESMEI